MTSSVRTLRDEALALPVAERAELAADLLASLDGEPDPDVEAAWDAEIQRQSRQARDEPDDDVSWESVRAELHVPRPA